VNDDQYVIVVHHKEGGREVGECMLCQQYVCRPSYQFLLASSIVVPMIIDGWLIGDCYDGALLV